MNNILKLLQWDIVLLNRNRLFFLSAIVVLIYIGIFYLIKPLGNLNVLLIVLIFNDPIVTGYLFGGVLLLFDKNQNILQAISVLPVSIKHYLLSKIIILSSLATILAFIMSFTIKGYDFNVIHLFASTFFSAFIFSCFGFTMAAVSKTFNHLLFYSIPFLIVSGIPFLTLFGYGKTIYFLLIPSAPGIELLQATFKCDHAMHSLVVYPVLIGWSILSWLIAVKTVRRKLI